MISNDVIEGMPTSQLIALLMSRKARYQTWLGYRAKGSKQKYDDGDDELFAEQLQDELDARVPERR